MLGWVFVFFLSVVLVSMGRSIAGEVEISYASPVELEQRLQRVIEFHEGLEGLGLDEKVRGAAVGFPMTSASGNMFMCYKLNENEAARNEDTDTDPERNEDSRYQMSKDDKIRNQLIALKGKCFSRKKDFWTYQVCPFDRVEQIRFEGNRKHTTFELGDFTSMEKRIVDDKGKKIVEWVQSFKGGTNGREARIGIRCRPSANPLVVHSIFEKQLHFYVVQAYSSTACEATEEWQAKQMLSTLEGRCFRRTEDWWTYELCYGKYLRQFHKEKSGKETEYILGTFDEVANEELERNGEMLSHDRSTGTPVLLQKFSGGTKCKLNGKKRSAIIHFMCSSHQGFAFESQGSIPNPTGILSITESPTCFYEVKVQTPLLCGHPFFAEGHAKAVSIVEKIHCVPEGLSSN